MKLFGIALLFLAPTLGGFWRGERIRQKRKILSALIVFLENLQTEISYFLRAQKDIFFDYRDPLLEKIGFLPLLRAECVRKPEFALKRCAEQFEKELLTEKQLSEAFLSFCQTFGSLPKKLQLEEGDKLIALMQKKEKVMLDKEENEIKLSRVIGLAIGIGTVILFL